MIIDPVSNIYYLWRNVIFGLLVLKAPSGLMCFFTLGHCVKKITLCYTRPFFSFNVEALLNMLLK